MCNSALHACITMHRALLYECTHPKPCKRTARQVLSDHFFSYGVVSPRLTFGGGFAVNMFFVMSGFVMTVGYGAKAAQAAATARDSLRFTRNFLARRIAQIGPVMWLSAIAYLPIALYVDAQA